MNFEEVLPLAKKGIRIKRLCWAEYYLLFARIYDASDLIANDWELEPQAKFEKKPKMKAYWVSSLRFTNSQELIRTLDDRYDIPRNWIRCPEFDEK